MCCPNFLSYFNSVGIEREKTHQELELSAEIKEALLNFMADRVKRGENITVEGVVAYLLCLATPSGSSYIAKEFKLHGKFRNLIREKAHS